MQHHLYRSVYNNVANDYLYTSYWSALLMTVSSSSHSLTHTSTTGCTVCFPCPAGHQPNRMTPSHSCQRCPPGNKPFTCAMYSHSSSLLLIFTILLFLLLFLFLPNSSYSLLLPTFLPPLPAPPPLPPPSPILLTPIALLPFPTPFLLLRIDPCLSLSLSAPPSPFLLPHYPSPPQPSHTGDYRASNTGPFYFCRPCQTGYYQDKEGQTECFKCPEGHFCPVSHIWDYQTS